MQITKITVSSSRKVPHPTLEFASLSSFVGMEAQLSDAEDIPVAALKLQDLADRYTDNHIARLTGDRRTAQHHYDIARIEKATADTAAKLAEKHGGKK